MLAGDSIRGMGVAAIAGIGFTIRCILVTGGAACWPSQQLLVVPFATPLAMIDGE
jgi:hypothetical protein